MSDFTDLMRRRHTVRSFDQSPVEDEKLLAVLEAARWAPTAVNAQPQRILVLREPGSLDKVREFCTFGREGSNVSLAKEFDLPGTKHISLYYGAPVVLVVCYERTACWSHPESGETSGPIDATIVATHMMLEATAQGLGSAWISYFDKDKARALLDIPADWEVCSMLYLGYPSAGERPAHVSGTRCPLADTCFFDRVPTTDRVV